MIHRILLNIGGAPAAYGDWLHASSPDAPTVLLYGHYDVQPADPEGGTWTTPPFSPTIRDDSVYARGAADNKGPVVGVLHALRALFASNDAKILPVNVKILIEGEEEIGSPTLGDIMEENGDTLKSDYAVNADSGQIGFGAPPGLLLGLRGSFDFEIKVLRQGSDLHSGEYGGAVGNPLHHLVRILDSLRDKETGSVLVDGFYDDVNPIGEMEKRDMEVFAKYVPWEAVLKSLGTSSAFGETGFSPYEQVWFRPTLEVVGFNGGYTAQGIKTVLPREASAKIACRLVTSQKAKDLEEKIIGFIGKMKVPGLDVKVIPLDSYAEPVRVARSSVANEAAKTVLKELYGKEPIYFFQGATVPAVEIIQRHLGLDAVSLGCSSPGTNIHAPDEYARLSELELTGKAYVKFLHQILLEHQRSGNVKESDKDEL